LANEEHLRILRQGVDAWNRWRLENTGVVPDLQDAKLRGMDLRSVDFKRTWLLGADLSEANLAQANLDRAILQFANLGRANLREASLLGANLRQANFTDADLTGADLSDANARDAVLDEARLRAAALFRTILHDALLRGTHFEGAELGHTVFGDVDLSSADGLEGVVHRLPSTIGLGTLYASAGRIPQSFLRGIGVPDELIDYLHVARSQFYSCFISYSSKDQDFAERLHADLQAKGVRCWFAPEDMKIGDKIWDRLDKSIRLHDKLLLILSANSIGSEWVEDEVTTAFEEERKRGKTVLFPVRVDDAIFSTHESWAAKVRQRHIGEFSNWKDHDAYKRAFDRLLRDLKAETPVAPAEDASH